MCKFAYLSYLLPFVFSYSSFSALNAISTLMLLVGCQEERLARNNLSDEMLALLSSGAKCK